MAFGEMARAALFFKAAAAAAAGSFAALAPLAFEPLGVVLWPAPLALKSADSNPIPFPPNPGSDAGSSPPADGSAPKLSGAGACRALK